MSLKMDILRSSFQSADIQKLKFPAFTSGRPETFGKDDADTNVSALWSPVTCPRKVVLSSIRKSREDIQRSLWHFSRAPPLDSNASRVCLLQSARGFHRHFSLRWFKFRGRLILSKAYLALLYNRWSNRGKGWRLRSVSIAVCVCVCDGGS